MKNSTIMIVAGIILMIIGGIVFMNPTITKEKISSSSTAMDGGALEKVNSVLNGEDSPKASQIPIPIMIIFAGALVFVVGVYDSRRTLPSSDTSPPGTI